MKKINNPARTAAAPTSHNLYCGYSHGIHNSLCAVDEQKLRLTPRLTPINTGKVLIGSAYQPSPCHIADDQLWLQESLLTKYTDKVAPIAMTLADKVIAALCVLAIVLVWITR